jgi:hypothetical protein
MDEPANQADDRQIWEFCKRQLAQSLQKRQMLSCKLDQPERKR